MTWCVNYIYSELIVLAELNEMLVVRSLMSLPV